MIKFMQISKIQDCIQRDRSIYNRLKISIIIKDFELSSDNVHMNAELTDCIHKKFV